VAAGHPNTATATVRMAATHSVIRMVLLVLRRQTCPSTVTVRVRYADQKPSPRKTTDMPRSHGRQFAGARQRARHPRQ
jgi:hypothetical protein